MLKKIKNFLKKIWEPPALTNNWKTIHKKKMASEWRELLLIDIIIIAFMIASMQQLAVFFAKGEPTIWAWLKSAAFDGAILLFSRNVSRAYVLGEKARGTWFALVFLALITVFANIGYEWFVEEGGIGDKYILKDWILNIRAALVSGSLPLIVVFMSTVRALAAISFEKRRRAFQEISDSEGRKKKRIEFTGHGKQEIPTLEFLENSKLTEAPPRKDFFMRTREDENEEDKKKPEEPLT